MTAIPPFGSPPTALATATKAGKVTLAQIPSPLPTTMQANLSIADHTQVYAHRRIKCGEGQRIRIGEEAVLSLGSSL